MARSIIKIFEIEKPEQGVSSKDPFTSKYNDNDHYTITLIIGTGNITIPCIFHPEEYGGSLRPEDPLNLPCVFLSSSGA